MRRDHRRIAGEPSADAAVQSMRDHFGCIGTTERLGEMMATLRECYAWKLELPPSAPSDANGVWKVLCRHGLNTRAKRLGLVAGYRAPYEPPRDPGPERHIDVDRPGNGRPTQGQIPADIVHGAHKMKAAG
jgi:hypothetical protein